MITDKYTNLELINTLDITKSYEKTLMSWHNNFINNKQTFIKRGFSEEFLRMWEFYFCYCAIGFNVNHIFCKQLVFKKINL